MKGLPSYPNPRLRGWRFEPGVPLPSLYYRFMRCGCRVLMGSLWKVRAFNRHLEPASGSAVYICNHQSFLDPMLMSMPLRRPMNYMARDSLFGFGPFARLIRSVNAFPVRRGTPDLAAMREAMRRLKAGGQVVVFAEGTRTRDGRIAPLLPGVAILAQRSADWTVPVVIDGAFEAWPRTQMLPSPGMVSVCYGQPISRDQAQALAPDQLMSNVRQTLIDLQADLRRRTGRSELAYP